MKTRMRMPSGGFGVRWQSVAPTALWDAPEARGGLLGVAVLQSPPRHSAPAKAASALRSAAALHSGDAAIARSLLPRRLLRVVVGPELGHRAELVGGVTTRTDLDLLEGRVVAEEVEVFLTR